MSPAEQQLLAADASAAGGSLLWFDDQGRRKKALRLVRTAETERFRNISLHQELFGSIRFDVGWHASAEEGLPPASLELPLIERPAFALLRHWRLLRVLNLAGMHRFIGFRAAFLPCLGAPHLCAISANGDADCAAISSGQAMQRVWLRATTLGLAFQVFAASTVYAQDGIDEVPASLRRQLQSGWDELSPGARPLVLFRMGFAPPASAQLKDDLIGPNYFFVAKNRWQLEAKEDMKSCGLCSPDTGDGLAMTFALPSAAVAGNSLQSQRQRKYDNEILGAIV